AARTAPRAGGGARSGSCPRAACGPRAARARPRSGRETNRGWYRGGARSGPASSCAQYDPAHRAGATARTGEPMEFMLILRADREATDDPSIPPEMGRFAGELAGSGKLRGGAPLHSEAQGARVTG